MKLVSKVKWKYDDFLGWFIWERTERLARIFLRDGGFFDWHIYFANNNGPTFGTTACLCEAKKAVEEELRKMGRLLEGSAE